MYGCPRAEVFYIKLLSQNHCKLFFLLLDDWKNFLEKLKMKEDILMMRVNEDKTLQVALKLRLWASYRGQTLARTGLQMIYCFLL